MITEREMIDKLKVAASWMDKAGAIIAVVMDPRAGGWRMAPRQLRTC